MAEFRIITELYCGTANVVRLANVEKWSDIEEWFVKWDVLHYTLDGETWHEHDLNSDTMDAVDWKHPSRVIIKDDITSEDILTVEDSSGTRKDLIEYNQQ